MTSPLTIEPALMPRSSGDDGATEDGEAAELLSSSSAVVVTLQPGVVVIELIGDHDLDSCERVAETIAHHAADGSGVVVSLAETSFIDSSTIRVLFKGDLGLLARGRRLVLHSPSGASVDRLVGLSGLRPTLLCCDTLDEAVQFALQSFHASLPRRLERS